MTQDKYERDVRDWNNYEILDELKERYKPTEIPPCRVCGGKLSIQSIGLGPTVWACDRFDEDGNRIKGRKPADEHYSKSRIEDHRGGGDDLVIELIRRYQEASVAEADPPLVRTPTQQREAELTHEAVTTLNDMIGRELPGHDDGGKYDPEKGPVMSNLKWHPIELFEKGETAVVWHPIKFFLTNKDGKAIENCPSLRLSPGDELYIVKGVKELYGTEEPPSYPDGSFPGGIYYIAKFRMAPGVVFSGGIRHKDESKNTGIYMHSQQGFTI